MAEPCIQKLAVERYSAGELAGPAAAGVEEHLRSCPSCSAYLAGLRKEREEFLRVHPFPDFLSAHAAPLRGGPWYKEFPAIFSLPALRPVLLPAVCVLLVAVVVVPYLAKRESRPANGILYKGPEALSYIYKRNGAVHTGAPDDVFRSGDRVQIFYSSSASGRYLSLFSIDKSGAVSFYQPDARAATCSIRSGTGSKLAYPVSIELDSIQGAELVVAVFSNESFDTSQIKRWVELVNSQGDLTALEKTVKKFPPAPRCSVLTLMLKKGS